MNQIKTPPARETDDRAFIYLVSQSATAFARLARAPLQTALNLGLTPQAICSRLLSQAEDILWHFKLEPTNDKWKIMTHVKYVK